MLSSQASTDSVKYVKTLIEDNFDKIFIFGGLNSNIFPLIQKMIAQKPEISQRIICLGKQDDTVIQPIMTRSNEVYIRGGGLSVMEQLAMAHNPKQRIFIHHADTSRKYLSSGMLWEDSNADTLITESAKQNIQVKKTTPKICRSRLDTTQRSFSTIKACTFFNLPINKFSSKISHAITDTLFLN